MPRPAKVSIFVPMKFVVACLQASLCLTGVIGAKTRQDNFERDTPHVTEVLNEGSLDDEVVAKEREISGLKAEIAQTKDALQRMQSPRTPIICLSALRVHAHEKDDQPVHSLPDKEKEVRTISTGSVASSKLAREQESKQQVAEHSKPSPPSPENTSVENATFNRSMNLKKSDASVPSVPSVPLASPNVSRYGSGACPCIGFDNLEGEAVTLIDGKMVKYPADLGSSCDAWDAGVHPDCTKAGGEWCKQPWCYVDPRQCKLDVLPTMSTYMPTARCYKHMPLFYSYSTFSDLLGFFLRAGREQGSKDLDNHPQCSVNGSKPEWCNRKLGVDPCSCSVFQPPKVSTYLNGTMHGRSIYYSYETCGSLVQLELVLCTSACTQTCQDACSKNLKCLWSGDSCLGKDRAIALAMDCRAQAQHK
eukprot:Skav236048  [mRNA]  locus=scaffold2566:11128:19466:+ [translate_table: standard]